MSRKLQEAEAAIIASGTSGPSPAAFSDDESDDDEEDGDEEGHAQVKAQGEKEGESTAGSAANAGPSPATHATKGAEPSSAEAAAAAPSPQKRELAPIHVPPMPSSRHVEGDGAERKEGGSSIRSAPTPRSITPRTAMLGLGSSPSYDVKAALMELQQQVRRAVAVTTSSIHWKGYVWLFVVFLLSLAPLLLLRKPCNQPGNPVGGC